MSTHNIGFYEDLTKIIFELSSNTHLISSAEEGLSALLCSIYGINILTKRLRDDFSYLCKDMLWICTYQKCICSYFLTDTHIRTAPCFDSSKSFLARLHEVQKNYCSHHGPVPSHFVKVF